MKNNSYNPEHSFNYQSEVINFCIKCGSNVDKTMPIDGDNQLRYICMNSNCQHVHYQNPKIVVGTISTYQNKILMCKRAINPQYGKWTLPAGFMENGESTCNGAYRETLEEANAISNIKQMFCLINIPQAMQVHIFYLASFDGKHSATNESLETKLFSIGEIPWSELSFGTVEYALKKYIEFSFEKQNNIVMPYHYTIIDNNNIL